MRKWKEKESFMATYGNLLKICCKVNATGVAKTICDALKSRVPSGENEGAEGNDFSGELGCCDLYMCA